MRRDKNLAKNGKVKIHHYRIWDLRSRLKQFWTAWSLKMGSIIPKRRYGNITVHYVRYQRSADLMYIAVEAWYHTQCLISCNKDVKVQDTNIHKLASLAISKVKWWLTNYILFFFQRKFLLSVQKRWPFHSYVLYIILKIHKYLWVLRDDGTCLTYPVYNKTNPVCK